MGQAARGGKLRPGSEHVYNATPVTQCFICKERSLGLIAAEIPLRMLDHIHCGGLSDSLPCTVMTNPTAAMG
jgi:hypothetical protein